jgi:hypothetical protein
MPDKPQIETLSLKHRNGLFFLLVVVFLVSLPVMIFYTTGYRLDLAGEENTIVTTGGVYITAENLEVDVYLDEEQVERPRFFRNAYYIQNITAGLHTIVVQRPDLTTWVKVLPVDPHIVIEASAFNMPAIPHLRPITEYVTATGTSVYFGVATSTDMFGEATTTVPVLKVPGKRTLGYVQNEEYVFVKSLFSTTSTTSRSVFSQILEGVERFRFSTTSPTDIATTTESVVERGNIRLLEQKNDLYAVWTGDSKNIPYYFCVTDDTASSTAMRYGQHVADAIEKFSVSTTTPLMVVGDRLCRPEIKLDRLRQDVYFYDFFPDSADLVLLQLEDGLYVTEIDDRSWQNVQKIYSGTLFQTVIENGVIYVHDGDHYFEVITEIEPL